MIISILSDNKKCGHAVDPFLRFNINELLKRDKELFPIIGKMYKSCLGGTFELVDFGFEVKDWVS